VSMHIFLHEPDSKGSVPPLFQKFQDPPLVISTLPCRRFD
jgi:hypothetical protein